MAFFVSFHILGAYPHRCEKSPFIWILVISCNSTPCYGSIFYTSLSTHQLESLASWLKNGGIALGCIGDSKAAESNSVPSQKHLDILYHRPVSKICSTVLLLLSDLLQEWPSGIVYPNYDRDATLRTIMMHHLKGSRWISHGGAALLRGSGIGWTRWAFKLFMAAVVGEDSQYTIGIGRSESTMCSSDILQYKIFPLLTVHYIPRLDVMSLRACHPLHPQCPLQQNQQRIHVLFPVNAVDLHNPHLSKWRC